LTTNADRTTREIPNILVLYLLRFEMLEVFMIQMMFLATYRQLFHCRVELLMMFPLHRQ